MSAIEQLSLDHIERAPVYTFDSLASYLAAGQKILEEKPRPVEATITRLPSAAGRPGDDFNAQHTGEEVLGWLGFTHAHTDHQGDHWTRPGKDPRQGASATVYPDGGIAIWSSGVTDLYPQVELRKSYDPFGLWVATQFNGDFEACVRDLAASGYGEPTFLGEDSTLIEDIEGYLQIEEGVQHTGGSTWALIDLSLAAQLGPPPPPDILHRSDGVALLYRGKLNFAFGPPESGKSWFAQLACVEVFNGGGSFLYIDAENGPRDVADHFKLLGADTSRMTMDEGRAMYIAPHSGWDPAAEALLQACVARKPDLVIVDGMTGAMSIMGKVPESNSDFSHFELEFLRPLMAQGAALLCIDHTPKGSETPTIFGAQHKKAATTGAAYSFTALEKPGRVSAGAPKGKRGLIRLRLYKDKGGYLRAYTDDEGVIADFFLTPIGPMLFAQLYPGGASPNLRPTNIMEKVSRYMECNGSCSEEKIQDVVGKQVQKPVFVAAAIRVLLEEKHLKLDNGRLTLVEKFRSDDTYFDDNDQI